MSSAPTGEGVPYRRIPGGQHGLAPEAVRADQLARIHAAMVRAAATSGYLATTVEDVKALAGVSRRTFYENYDNKLDCLLASCDVVVSGWMREGVHTYQEAICEPDADIRDRLRAALKVLFESVDRDRLGARLVFVEQLNCGSAGVENLERTLERLEDMLRGALTGPDGTLPIPPALIKVFIGGVLEIVTMRVRRERTAELPCAGRRRTRVDALLPLP